MNEARIQRLVEEYQDDALSESECRELVEWFDEDDSHVSMFAAEIKIANTLTALNVMESDCVPLAVKDSLQRSSRSIDISRNVRQRIESQPQRLPADAVRLKPPFRKWASWCIATSTVAALIAFYVFLPTQPDTIYGVVIATVKNTHKVQEVSAGDPLRTGQVLKLVDGRVKINFHSGARLAIQAPAELKLLGPNSAQLLLGVATVRVPGRIKGFVLITPHQRVTDLGTSFGVDVDRTGDTAISVFEGEIELEHQRRLVGGQSVALTATEQPPREIPYALDPFLGTWQASFGVNELVGNVRVAIPAERRSPGLARDSASLLLFPEREDVILKRGFVVDGMEPGTFQRPFRKHTVKLVEDVRVDSFLLQYNPVHDDEETMNQNFSGELHFDRPIVAVILQKDLLDSSDAMLALPSTDFRNIFRRGINDSDVVTLSRDRRVLSVELNVKNGVDQIRVLVATDNNLNNQQVINHE